MNPLSDFLKIQPNGNRLTEQQAQIAKIGAFCRDVFQTKAITSTGRRVLLGEKEAKLNNVDFVAGLWRVQRKFPHKIVRVRDKDMVLLDKIEHTESTNFEYWTAKLVGYNCYGPFISYSDKPDFIVAKYDTDYGPRWGYGKTLEEARAFLGLKMYDEYRDVVHVAACQSKIKSKTK